jgi:stearoyl-CoA desaturase (delta-9 desaturase)
LIVLAIVAAVLIGLLTAQVSLLLTTVYLHRGLSHRALTLSRPVAEACRAVLWISTGVRQRQWVAVHRKHHAFTDETGDPHSPLLFGFLRVQFGNIFLYRRVARDPAMVARYARDIPADRWDRYLFDHALVGLGIGIATLIYLLGWELGLIAATVHASTYLLGGGAINAVGHRWGQRPYPNLATNNQWLAWLVVGEGLHNNHHQASTSPRLSLSKGEFDPGWWAIRLLVSLRLATLRRMRASAPVG